MIYQIFGMLMGIILSALGWSSSFNGSRRYRCNLWGCFPESYVSWSIKIGVKIPTFCHLHVLSVWENIDNLLTEKSLYQNFRYCFHDVIATYFIRAWCPTFLMDKRSRLCNVMSSIYWNLAVLYHISETRETWHQP